MLWETLSFECNDVIFNGIHKMIAKRVQKIWLGRTMYNQKPLLQVFDEMTYENNLPVQIVGDKLHLQLRGLGHIGNNFYFTYIKADFTFDAY